MLRRLISTLALAIPSLVIDCHADSIPISSYLDDPFVTPSVIKNLDASDFGEAEDGRPIMRTKRIWVTEDGVIFRRDQNGVFQPFAWNPWAPSWANPRWDLTFPNEDRFPLFKPLRGADNQIVLKDGLQVWLPQDLNLGNTTAFEAASSVKDASELWSGRSISWGDNGFLLIETHTFVDFNALYSPATKALYFGVIPYRLAGHTDVNMFETSTSWDMAAHESGHAVHHPLKPNVDQTDAGFNTWGESFADQTSMWTSLMNPDRVAALLAETHGDFNQSNSLSRLVEAFAALVGQGTSLRDAFNSKKVSDTSDEVHDRSEVITGAAYRLFLVVFDDCRRNLRDEDALREAGRIMGTFLTHATDYTPENQMMLTDVAKAYLKVDKELFSGRYHDTLVSEFAQRELLDDRGLHDWLAHDAALPSLWLPSWSTDADVATFVAQRQDSLGIAPDFGIRLQSVTRLLGTDPGRMIVRVQLTQGRGADAVPLNNHGILVFRPNGDLADYHPPIPGDAGSGAGPDVTAAAIDRARQARLHLKGVPLSLVRRQDGTLAAEAHVLRGQGLNSYMEVFTLENPNGQRRELLHSPLSSKQQLLLTAITGF